MTIGIRLDSIQFSGGQTVGLEPDTIIVLVGPNNAGKSRALREIQNGLGGRQGGRVVSGVEFTRLGDKEAAHAWIEENTAFSGDYSHRHGMGGLIGDDDVADWPVVSSRHGAMAIARHLCLLANAEHRFEVLKPARAFNPLRDPPAHPVHYVLTHQDLEQKLDSMLWRAFGENFIINWASGQLVQLHVGNRPQTQDRVSADYLRELDAVPLLPQHGDGLKSFVGCALQVMAGPWSVVLLDEPEIFLHPPQAQLLGQWLAAEAPTDRQMVIATHSADLLRGLLQARASRVRLVRLRRVNDVNTAHVLQREAVEAVGRDPALRFTNLLDSLFHSSTVLCESDADCRFYDAVLAAIQPPGAQRPMFVPVGGKQAIAKVATALATLGVEFHAVADFDVLNNQQVLASLWRAFGGEWTEIERVWKIVKSGVETSSEIPLRGTLREKLNRILQGPDKERISDREAEQIRDLARGTTGWSHAKLSGLNGLPQGDVAEAGRQLLETLGRRSLHVVPCGELERFVLTVAGKSGEWVTEVLGSRNLADDVELGAARGFVGSLAIRSNWVQSNAQASADLVESAVKDAMAAPKVERAASVDPVSPTVKEEPMSAGVLSDVGALVVTPSKEASSDWRGKLAIGLVIAAMLTALVLVLARR